jgi:proline racemase
MENKLAEALALKGVLPAGTEVEAYYTGVALGGVANVKVSGQFSIVSIGKRKDGTVVFVLAALRDGATHKVLATDVTVIDGMDPERFASVYDIKACGGTAAPKARRGRKPKDRSPEGLARAAALAALAARPEADNDDDFDDREVA